MYLQCSLDLQTVAIHFSARYLGFSQPISDFQYAFTRWQYSYIRSFLWNTQGVVGAIVGHKGIQVGLMLEPC